ncbi:ABC-2 type transport system ATP-binding protein [Bacillus chungangensis]|uniref:ABC-2 type transport system ATP-binding protein n=2 Tax=Bacillus chungangensis TaxID=587633 RepID=A0ABT9WST2_9BACI|nr:ABC-2 type transport system ATP-binding protein [Bacillus chungangensis]
MNTVELMNVTKKYKNFTLNNVSFSIKKGYITGFIGENGAGKSTTIKLIMNLIKRDSGDIRIFGDDNLQHSTKIKERIGFVYDENYFYEELTIKELRRIIAPFYSKWDDHLFQQYIDMFELPMNQRIKSFSKGMKMKTSIVFALAHHPDFIIMDEPTSGLDPIFRREILDIFHDVMLDEEKTIFFSSHITTDLDRIADYITFIHKGNIIFSQEKDILLERYSIVKGDKQLLDDDTKNEFVSIRQTSVGFEALTSNTQKTKAVFGDDVLYEKPSLEDIMYFTSKGDIHV